MDLGSIIFNGVSITIIIGFLTFVFFYYNSDKVVDWLYRRSLGNREYVIQKMDLMFIEVNRNKITMTMLVMSFGVGLIFFFSVWPSFLLGLFLGTVITVVGWSAPRWIINYLYEKRCNQFVDQLVDGVTIMANGVRSGLTPVQCMERVAQNLPNPISQEFNYCLSQVRLGLSLEESLNGLATRVPKPDVQMLVMAINILKETGGNLAETFATISETIRERQKVLKKIEALTAQGLMQGIIITLVPFALLIIFLVVDPGYVKPLFTTTLGIIFLFAMLGLQILGGVMVNKIVRIKV